MAKSCKKHLVLLEYSIARICYPSYWLKKGTNYPQITELKSTNHGKIIYILRNFQEILCNSTNYLYLCTHIIQAYKGMTFPYYLLPLHAPLVIKQSIYERCWMPISPKPYRQRHKGITHEVIIHQICNLLKFHKANFIY